MLKKEIIETLFELPHDDWRPNKRFIYKILAKNVIAVASVTFSNLEKRRRELYINWKVSVDAVEGINYNQEWRDVEAKGTKVNQEIAEAIFPQLKVLDWST